MDPITIATLGAGVASAASGVASSLGIGSKRKIKLQENSQKRLMDYQNNINRANYEMQLASQREENAFYWDTYNSPTAQKAAYEEAGLNPEMMLGSSNPGVSSSGASVGGVSIPGAPEISPINPMQEALSTASGAISLLDTQAQLADRSSANKYNRDARIANLLSMREDLDRKTLQNDLLRKELGVFDERESRARQEHYDRLLSSRSNRQHQNAQEAMWLAQQDLQEKEFKETQRVNDANIELTEQQTRTARQDNDYFDRTGFRSTSAPAAISYMDFLLGEDTTQLRGIAGRAGRKLQKQYNRYQSALKGDGSFSSNLIHDTPTSLMGLFAGASVKLKDAKSSLYDHGFLPKEDVYDGIPQYH